MLRKTREDLKDTIATAERMFGNAASYSEKGAVFRFSNGARLYMAFLERESDAEHYQGWSLTRVYIEEMTQFADAGAGHAAAGDAAIGARHPLPAAGPPATPAAPAICGSSRGSSTTAPYRRTTDAENRTDPGVHPGADPRQPGAAGIRPALCRSAEGRRLPAAGACLAGGRLGPDRGCLLRGVVAGRHVIQPFSIPADWTRFRSMD